jgi:hypothetical protein
MLEWLQGNGSGASQATFIKLQQKASSTEDLFHVHRQAERDLKDDWHSCRYVISA